MLIEVDTEQQAVVAELMTHHVDHLKKYGFVQPVNVATTCEWFKILKPEYPDLMVAVGEGFYSKDTILYLPGYRDKLLERTRKMVRRHEGQLVRARRCLEMVEQQRLPHGWPKKRMNDG